MRRYGRGHIAGLAILLLAVVQGRADTVVADFVDDMPSSGGPNAWYSGNESEHPGWQYMYAPDGAIGKSANYVSLQPCTLASPFPSDVPDPMYVRVGNLPYNDAGQGEGKYMRLSVGSIHPGAGAKDVQPMAAYTIQGDDGEGSYEITNSLLRSLKDNTKYGGADLRVYVNDTLVHSLLGVSTFGSPDANFDVSLGKLKPGDTVYVAYGNGAQNNSGADACQIDFTLVRKARTATDRILLIM